MKPYKSPLNFERIYKDSYEDKMFFFKGAHLIMKIRQTQKEHCYSMKLSKITGLGYAKVVELVNLFNKLELAEFNMLNKRIKGIVLTKKGEEVADKFISIKRNLQ